MSRMMDIDQNPGGMPNSTGSDPTVDGVHLISTGSPDGAPPPPRPPAVDAAPVQSPGEQHLDVRREAATDATNRHNMNQLIEEAGNTPAMRNGEELPMGYDGTPIFIPGFEDMSSEMQSAIRNLRPGESVDLPSGGPSLDDFLPSMQYRHRRVDRGSSVRMGSDAGRRGMQEALTGHGRLREGEAGTWDYTVVGGQFNWNPNFDQSRLIPMYMRFMNEGGMQYNLHTGDWEFGPSHPRYQNPYK